MFWVFHLFSIKVVKDGGGEYVACDCPTTNGDCDTCQMNSQLSYGHVCIG